MRVHAGERRASSRVRATVEGLPIIVWEADAATGEQRSMVGRNESTRLGRGAS